MTKFGYYVLLFLALYGGQELVWYLFPVTKTMALAFDWASLIVLCFVFAGNLLYMAYKR